MLPGACRFYPTCSEYMLEAVRKHGVWAGVWMGIKRLGRCHPFHEGGYDPVH
jgi:putative membrane protein insertion efficiency factor